MAFFMSQDRATLNRIDIKVTALLEGLEIRERLLRIETMLDTLAAGMTPEQQAEIKARLAEASSKLAGISQEP